MKDFIPTYLMIKRHIKTGMLYFCKTTEKNPYMYKGSGRYWKNHMKVHGRNVETIWCHLFKDKDELTEFALFFSDFHNIVKQLNENGNKVWANEVPEDGLQGGQNRGLSGYGVTNYGNRHTDEAKKLMCNFGEKNGMFNKKHTVESIMLMKAHRPDQTGARNPFAIKCHTPLGWFDTIKQASKAHEVSEPTLRKRLNSTNEDHKDYYRGKTK